MPGQTANHARARYDAIDRSVLGPQNALIDLSYPFKSRRMDWLKETRMTGTSEAAQTWAQETFGAGRRPPLTRGDSASDAADQ